MDINNRTTENSMYTNLGKEIFAGRDSIITLSLTNVDIADRFEILKQFEIKEYRKISSTYSLDCSVYECTYKKDN